ncbi:MAG TPA: DUF3341 domain-containing protein, partial [Planctomycetaceae bacterium]|nr:DUF3341 domain-containing protein [Planctomycetaceae bacterium]
MNDQAKENLKKETLAALLGRFSSPESVREAAARFREEGFVQFDVHSPFPIHGIEKAVGIRGTRLPWLVLLGGMGGGVFALWLQWWTNAVDYPLIISGKPLFSLPANIPVIFELTVLFSAFAAFFGALLLNRLPRLGNPLSRSECFRRATTDGFFLVIDPADPQFEENKVRRLLEICGAEVVEGVSAASESVQVPRRIPLATVIVLLLAAIPPLSVAVDRLTPSAMPRMHPVPDMDNQPKFKTQAATSLFPDHCAMRQPVPGTIARGQLREDEHFYRGKVNGQFVDSFPRRLGP